MLVLSISIEGGALVAYEALKEPPKPNLIVLTTGQGSGAVHVEAVLGSGAVTRTERLTCRGQCVLPFPRGAALSLSIELDDGSTFEGWGGACTNLDVDEILKGERDPLTCAVTIAEDTRVEVGFGLVPEQLEVAWAKVEPTPSDEPREFTVTLPDTEIEAELLLEPLPELLPEPQPEPQQPQPQPEPQQQQQPTAPAPQVQQPPPQNLTSVEVPDENEVEDAPDDAQFLSDKNRDVAEQTHAQDTNLEREQRGDGVVSEQSDIESDDIGAAEDVIAQLEETEPNTLDPRRPEESEHTGDDERAVGAVEGDEGQDGEDGDAGDDTPKKDPGMLAMRDLKGTGGVFDKAEQGDRSGARGRKGKRGRKGIETDLAFEDYERIVGKEVADEEIKLGKRQLSKRRGRWEKKLGAVKSALENFTPDVKPGNQTALKTRAAPFAVYLARMHRRIHELWGFGFLEDLNDKGADHPLNHPDLWTELEIVINPDGTVHKTTITKNSGRLEFDVAAIDTILTAAPYEPTPNKIRSPDGRVYMRWSFWRNHRQCGTFNAQPFILSEAPSGEKVDDGDMVRNVKRSIGRGDGGRGGDGAGPENELPMPVVKAPADANRGTVPDRAVPTDQRARHVENLWVTGLTQRNVKRMVQVSGTPFRSGEQVVANSADEIAAVYQSVLGELGRGLPTSKVLSPAEYRKLFGALPAGFEMNKDKLLLVVRVGDQRLTLELVRTGAEYKIMALHR